VIYNDFSTQSQPLVKNTRFLSASGKIYRIQNPVTVPGQKTSGGKKVPGSVEVDVYADVAGSEYNTGLTDFTIPGFKGSPKYEKFYARSKTSMSGGFSGIMKIVSEADVQKAKESIVVALKDKLFAEALVQKPNGTVLYKNATSYVFTDTRDNAATEKKVKLTVKGTLTVPLFNTKELSMSIVKTYDPSVGGTASENFGVTNIEDLVFITKNEKSIPLKQGETYSFLLNGTSHAVWVVDSVALVEKLLGAKKDGYESILSGFSGIEKASAVVRPFWKTKFPSDASKIQVNILPE
jgi:hypothetical protein